MESEGRWWLCQSPLVFLRMSSPEQFHVLILSFALLIFGVYTIPILVVFGIVTTTTASHKRFGFSGWEFVMLSESADALSSCMSGIDQTAP